VPLSLNPLYINSSATHPIDYSRLMAWDKKFENHGNISANAQM